MSRRLSTRSAVTALAVVAFDAALLACPICFQVEENATTKGVQAAVVVLAGITTCVLGAFGAFVVRFARRETRAFHAEGAEKAEARRVAVTLASSNPRRLGQVGRDT